MGTSGDGTLDTSGDVTGTSGDVTLDTSGDGTWGHQVTLLWIHQVMVLGDIR